MRPLHRTQPDEATTLAMENDLLRLEVVHVRARLLAAEAELRRIEKVSGADVAGATPAPGVQDGAGLGVDPAPDSLADLQWLLARIEGSALSHVLRRRDGYRRLVDTYLREDAG